MEIKVTGLEGEPQKGYKMLELLDKIETKWEEVECDDMGDPYWKGTMRRTKNVQSSRDQKIGPHSKSFQ